VRLRNLKCGSYAISLRGEFYKTGLENIWLGREIRDLKDICQIM